MSGLRGQAAPLPGASTNLHAAAAAYARGDTTSGDHYFRAAFLDTAPLVRRTIERHLTQPEDRDDAFQHTMLSLWNAVRAGNVPAIELRARGAAIDRFRRETRHERHRAKATSTIAKAFKANQITDDYAEFEPVSSEDHVAFVEAGMAVDDLAARAGAARPLWGMLVHLLAQGATPAEAAQALGRPRGTIRRNIVELRAWWIREVDA